MISIFFKTHSLIPSPNNNTAKQQFRWRLIYRVATAHGAFLAKQPGQPSVPWATLKRWHSKFDLESVPGEGLLVFCAR